jgi:hypothetical protein
LAVGDDVHIVVRLRIFDVDCSIVTADSSLKVEKVENETGCKCCNHVTVSSASHYGFVIRFGISDQWPYNRLTTDVPRVRSVRVHFYSTGYRVTGNLLRFVAYAT